MDLQKRLADNLQTLESINYNYGKLLAEINLCNTEIQIFRARLLQVKNELAEINRFCRENL